MNDDYLNLQDPGADTGDDWLGGSGDGGYLGLEDPAPPTGHPEAPTAPAAPSNGGDWMSGGSSSSDDDWLGGSTTDHEPVADSGWGDLSADAGGSDGWSEPADGGYFGEPSAPAAVMAPQAPAAPTPMPAPAAMAPTAPQHHGGHELSVQAPYLENVAPSVVSVGGTKDNLSALVLDVEVPVEVYFGDAMLTVEEFLEMGPGSVVELDHAIEMPIELRVRGNLVARGQLVTINGNYGMRITDMTGEGR